jgi:hypothetical protein
MQYGPTEALSPAIFASVMGRNGVAKLLQHKRDEIHVSRRAAAGSN